MLRSCGDDAFLLLIRPANQFSLNVLSGSLMRASSPRKSWIMEGTSMRTSDEDHQTTHGRSDTPIFSVATALAHSYLVESGQYIRRREQGRRHGKCRLQPLRSIPHIAKGAAVVANASWYYSYARRQFERFGVVRSVSLQRLFTSRSSPTRIVCRQD